MEYHSLGVYNISRIGLGTVQFGIDYGINNSSGQVTYNEIVEILYLAQEKGINFIDTSRAYGSSEERIGRALKEIGITDPFIICTKLDLPDNFRELSETGLLSAASDCLEKSREMLGLDRLPVYLLHKPEYRSHMDGVVWEFLKDKKKEGVIGHLGISIVRGPEEAVECLKDPAVEAIQIPYNLFDDRWYRAGILEEADRKGVVVFNRSTYLQGLLLMDLRDVTVKFPKALPYIRSLERFIKEKDYDRKKLIFKYVLSTPSICSTIIGIDSLKQLEENIAIFQENRLDQDIMKNLRRIFYGIPEYIVNPALWPKVR